MRMVGLYTPVARGTHGQVAVPPKRAMEGILKLMETYLTKHALLAGLKAMPNRSGHEDQRQ